MDTVHVQVPIPENIPHRAELAALTSAIPGVEPSRNLLLPMTALQAREKLCNMLDTHQLAEAFALARMMTTNTQWHNDLQRHQSRSHPVIKRVFAFADHRHAHTKRLAQDVQSLRKQIHTTLKNGADVRALAWKEDHVLFRLNFWTLFEKVEIAAMEKVVDRAPICVHIMNLIGMEAKMSQPTVIRMLEDTIARLPHPFDT